MGAGGLRSAVPGGRFTRSERRGFFTLARPGLCLAWGGCGCPRGLFVVADSQDRFRFDLPIPEFLRCAQGVQSDSGRPEERWLSLVHGKTLHGLQCPDPSRVALPTSYYGEQSGVGRAWRALSTAPRRIGLVGLGIGTLTTYARTGDYVHIYEINPEVIRLATKEFKYLTNCAGKVEVTLGDARLSLEREPPQNFDLLVLDAFSSDAIPVHLLTREAFAIYERHLNPSGVIAVHVSNTSMNLEPVVVNLARHCHYEMTTIDYVPPRDKPWLLHSVWMLLSHNGQIIHARDIRLASRPPETNSVKYPPLDG